MAGCVGPRRVLFGFSHITNYVLSDWRYVILASIAGIFLWLDLAEKAIRSLLPRRSCAGRYSWHFFFRTF